MFLGIEALIGCMGGHILSAIKAAKTLKTTVSIANKTIKAVKKNDIANKGNCRGGKI